MRHQNKISKLGRTSAHRKATMAAMSNALITHKRITTTLAKAKALRTFVEPIITRAKDDNTHNRRQVFRRLQDKRTVTELFSDIAEKIGDRPGGYTRVIKLGQRAGDSAEMALIELVDYNDSGPSAGGGGGRKRTRRGRSGTGTAAKAPVAAAVADDAAVADEPAAEADAADASASATPVDDAGADGRADEDAPEADADADDSLDADKNS